MGGGGQGEENSIILQNDGQLGEKGKIFHITKVKEQRPSKGQEPGLGISKLSKCVIYMWVSQLQM